MNKKLSYTAVKGQFPLKVIANKELLSSIIKNKRIIPYHVRLNITGKCNLKCEWCSRSKTDRQLELSYKKIIDIITEYWGLGCRAVTISGSGEPLMHKNINALIRRMRCMVDLGLITNGWFLKRLTKESLKHLTWIRISLGDNRIQPRIYWRNIQQTIGKGEPVDWSFSYILTKKPCFELIKEMIEFANKNNFTHIRIMSDLNIENNELAENELRSWLHKESVNTNLLIYQDSNYSIGNKKCLVGLLRPVIDTDGTIYPCCNTQFAINSSDDWVKTMSLGTIKDIKKLCLEQKSFDGTKCQKCYSDHYNELLNSLLSEVNHQKFV